MALLQGRIAIVTGASSGIGAATAVALAAEGATVLLAARRKDRLEGVARTIREAGGIAVPVPTDVTSEEQVLALFDRVQKDHGRLDLLVNNAGIGGGERPLEEWTLAEWHALLEANMTSVFLCSREAVKIMKVQNRGRIITIGSIASRTPRPNGLPYAATKAALTAMNLSLAIEGREHNITATILHPGATVTELSPGMEGRPPRVSMRAEEIGRMIVTIAGMPDETNVLETLMLPVGQPFLARG